MAFNSTFSAAEIESVDVWAAARRLGMYGMGQQELEALVARHGRRASFARRVIAEAALHVVGLRRALAAGEDL